MSDKNSKELRKQLRNVVKEILPELMSDILLQSIEKKLEDKIKVIDDRNKQIFSYLLRNLSTTPPPSEKK